MTARSHTPRRVLLTADTIGGVWTFAADLSRALAARGIRIGLATMGAPVSSDRLADLADIEGLELFESAYRLEWMDEGSADAARAGDWLLGLAQRFRPDVVHLNGYCYAALPWKAPTLVTGHSCVLSWWEAVHGEPAPPSWDRYASAVRRGLQAAHLVTAPTAAMLADLQRLYGPLRSARVVPNGRDLGKAGRLPLPSKEPLILAAGRLWDEAKNVRALCAVAPELPWPVYVAGDLQGPGGAHAEVGGAHPLGRLSSHQLQTWYAKAAIFVLAARYEPFGLSALEAALAGCVLVLGDIRSLREVWRDAAVYVAPDNRRALANALRELIGRPARRRVLARLARTRAAELTVERMAAGYLQAYRDLLGQGTPPARHQPAALAASTA